MAAPPPNQVPWRIHRYDKPLVQGLPVRRAAIPKNAFRPRAADASMDFRGIIKGGAKPTGHSPSTEQYNGPFADLHMIRELCKNLGENMQRLQHSWLGGLLKFKHRIAIREIGSGQWLCPLRAEQGSTVLVWPMSAGRCSLTGHQHSFRLDNSVSEPWFIVVWSPTEWEAVDFVFHSPAWVAKNRPQQHVMRESCFWSLPKQWLDLLAQHLGCPTEPGSNLFQTCWAVCRHILGDERESDMASCLEQRLVRMTDDLERSDGQYTDGIPDADEILERRDEKQMQQQAKFIADDVESIKDVPGQLQGEGRFDSVRWQQEQPARLQGVEGGPEVDDQPLGCEEDDPRRGLCVAKQHFRLLVWETPTLR